MSLVPLTAGDAARIQELLGDDQRLFMRIGALLQDGVACTDLLLEEVNRERGLRSLLMDRNTKQVTAENLADLCAKHGLDEDFGLILDEAEHANATWRVLGLEDELNNPFAITVSEPEVLPADGSVNAMLPSLAAPVRASVEGLLQAKGDDDRAAALEQLRYAAPSLDVLAGLMPLVLADGAQVVRERALALLGACGARPLAVDCIRALHRGDEPELLRLAEQLTTLDPLQERLILGALLALLGQGQLSPGALAIMQCTANELAAHPDLERTLELLLLHGKNLSLLPVIRALQTADRARIDNSLRGFLGVNEHQDARVILFLAQDDVTDSDSLLERGLELLLAGSDLGHERLPLAQGLRRMVGSQRMSAALAARCDLLKQCTDNTPFWMLAESCREGSCSQSDADTIAEAITYILREGEGPHVVAILENELPYLLPCQDHLRSAMVAPLAELAARYRDSRSRELIVINLEGMGASAIDALWQVVEVHPTGAVREAIASVLPIVIQQDNDIEPAILRILAALPNATTDSERGELVLAAARLCDRLSQDPNHVCEQVDTAISGIGIAAIEATATLAAGIHVSNDRRLAMSEQLLQLITADIEEDASTQEIDPTTQEITFNLDPKLSAHTDIMPRVLQGMVAVAASPQLPSQAQRRVIMQLIGQWRKVSSWNVLWGPANIVELARTLSRIGAAETTPNAMRLQIAEALLPRCTQLRIARHASLLFHAGEGDRLSAIAGRMLSTIITAVGQNYYADDELTDLCDVLVHFLALPELGPQDQRLRQQIASLLRSYRNHCGSRTRRMIRELLPQFTTQLASELDWA